MLRAIGKKEAIQSMAAVKMDRERLVIRAQSLSVYEHKITTIRLRLRRY